MSRTGGWRACLILILGCLFLGGCRFDGSTLRVQGYLFTVYNMPRALRPGPVRIGLRVQDRDYRILSRLTARLDWIEPGTGTRRTAAMEPGPGRDFRARIVLPQPGEYALRMSVILPEGTTLPADFLLRVPADKNRNVKN